MRQRHGASNVLCSNKTCCNMRAAATRTAGVAAATSRLRRGRIALYDWCPDARLTSTPPMGGHLQHDLKQRTPFESLEAEVFLNVLRTATTLVRDLVEVLRPFDLTQPQYNVLRILRGAGAAGLPCGEVGERMVSRDPDVSRLLDRMEGRGLVVRTRAPADRRVVTARITPDGLRIVGALDEPVRQMHSRQLGHLPERDLRALSELLEAARESAPAASTEPPQAARATAPPEALS